MPDVITTASPSRILLVEDEPSISDIVSTALRYQGHAVTSVDDGRTGLERAGEDAFDLIVLDVMLPGLDGFEVCRRLREQGSSVPVLFLTARDEPDDRIRGFVSGGDDYLTKPFTVDELVLRAAAILRRTGHEPPSDLLVVGELTLDPQAQEVHLRGALIELSATEFRVLHHLMINRGVVLSKFQLLWSVWGEDFDGSENVVELYIGYLRRKLDHDRTPLIHTRRGAGYILREERG